MTNIEKSRSSLFWYLPTSKKCGYSTRGQGLAKMNKPLLGIMVRELAYRLPPDLEVYPNKLHQTPQSVGPLNNSGITIDRPINSTEAQPDHQFHSSS